jgi:dihydroorotate dehydrogenase
MMYTLLRTLLFRFPPEFVHHLTLRLIALAGDFPPLAAYLRASYTVPPRPQSLFGLTFPNRVGLAAGYDKDGLAWRGLACLGFGHIEVGTVTLKPQAGNPRPRLFRLPAAQALINRLGFPGQGADFVARQLSKPHPPGLILGVNLGINKDTPLENAARDYLQLLEIFSPLADYLVINVSSPNTLGLRQLQARQSLDDLLAQLHARRVKLASQGMASPPLLVKLSPDLSDAELDDALDVLLARSVDGVIATNTTIARQGVLPENLVNTPLGQQSGGLSGLPLFSISLAMVKKISLRCGDRLPIIGVGGIMNKDAALQMLEAGASLIQIYTGLIYNGPSFVKQLASL